MHVQYHGRTGAPYSTISANAKREGKSNLIQSCGLCVRANSLNPHVLFVTLLSLTALLVLQYGVECMMSSPPSSHLYFYFHTLAPASDVTPPARRIRLQQRPQSRPPRIP